MSAAEPLAFTDNFARDGDLDQQQPEPWKVVEADRVERAITRLHAEGDPRMGDFHPTDEPGRMQAGEDAKRAVAEAIIEVERIDRRVIDRKATSAVEWANLIGTAAKGTDRRHVLLRVGGKLLHTGLAALPTLAMLLVHNRCMNVPPLAVSEVELIWRSLCDRHGAERS